MTKKETSAFLLLHICHQELWGLLSTKDFYKNSNLDWTFQLDEIKEKAYLQISQKYEKNLIKIGYVLSEDVSKISCFACDFAEIELKLKNDYCNYNECIRYCPLDFRSSKLSKNKECFNKNSIYLKWIHAGSLKTLIKYSEKIRDLEWKVE